MPQAVDEQAPLALNTKRAEARPASHLVSRHFSPSAFHLFQQSLSPSNPSNARTTPEKGMGHPSASVESTCRHPSLTCCSRSRALPATFAPFHESVRRSCPYSPEGRSRRPCIVSWVSV